MSESKSPMTMIADVEIAQKLRVKLKTGTTTAPPEVDIAGTELGIGTNEALVAVGKDAAINTWNKSGSLEMVASSAISVGDEVEAVAGGKVATFSAGTKVGTALEAATADGDIIEVLPNPAL